MFVPIHAHKAGAAGKPAQVKIKPAIIMAVATAVGAGVGIVSDVLHAGSRGGRGSGAIGLAIGVGAAGLGLALARAIGRQVKA